MWHSAGSNNDKPLGAERVNDVEVTMGRSSSLVMIGCSRGHLISGSLYLFVAAMAAAAVTSAFLTAALFSAAVTAAVTSVSTAVTGTWILLLLLLLSVYYYN